MLPQGHVLQDRYRIVHRIGGGGMGTVYLAEDIRLPGRRCAVKEASPRQLPEGDRQWATDAFRQEAQMLATLSHPGLTPVTDFFSETACLYLVMDYVPGKTLEQVLEENPSGRLPHGQVLNIVRQLCDVLGYLHSQNPPVIFRDLKPSNVMLMPDGQVKLIDFGIARFFKSTKSHDTVTLGTPGYAAPEQWGSAGQSDARSDIYGLGVLLLHLSTGYDPVPNPFPLPKPSDVLPSISPKIEHLVLLATQPEPGLRYQSIADFRRDVDTPSEKLRPLEKTSVLPQQSQPFAQVEARSSVPPQAPPVAYQAPATPYPSPPTPYPPSAMPYPQAAPRRKRTWLWVVLAVVAVLAIGLCAAAMGGALALPSLFGGGGGQGGVPTIGYRQPTLPPVSATLAPDVPTPEPATEVPGAETPFVEPTVEVDTALRWESIGKSVQGRDLEVGIIGDERGDSVVLVGSIQGDQTNTRDLLYSLAEDLNGERGSIPSGVTFYIIPTINPDGNAASTRRNAHNVDLNRNWDTFDWTKDPEQPEGVVKGAGGSRPHSEPETQSLANYLIALKSRGSVRLVLWHSSQRLTSGGQVYPGYTSSGLDSASFDLARRYADSAGYVVRDDWAPYETTGELIAWCAEEGVGSIDVVIPSSTSGSSSSLRRTTVTALFKIAEFP
ncbi:MAG: protein kinase domain-containing protein [Anaerolineae bacterium]|jgi:serine/threonine protein kinase